MFCRILQNNAENTSRSHLSFLGNTKFRALNKLMDLSRLVFCFIFTQWAYAPERGVCILEVKKQQLNNENIFLTKTRSPNSSITAEREVQFWNLYIFIPYQQLQLRTSSFCHLFLTLMSSTMPCKPRLISISELMKSKVLIYMMKSSYFKHF